MSSQQPSADASLLWRRRLLLAVASIIAGAGVAYELSLMLLGTVTVGSTERANAIVLGTAMLGMGIGATTGGRLASRPVANFVRVELLLALLGASAAPLLYWTWSQLDSLWGPLLGVSLAIGICIGAEMPLLAALNERLVEQSAAQVVSSYTAADYFGAIIGAIGFAFVVRPMFGLVEGTIVVAVINLIAAASVVFIVPSQRRGSTLRWVAGAAVLLVAAAAGAPQVVADGRQVLFRDPIVARAESGLQELVVTSRTHPGGQVDTRLFLNNDLQLSSIDEHRYHESLVHPAIAASGGAPSSVLILGGGDCLAAREVLRYPSVESVTLVELDAAVVEMMRTVPELAAIQNGACDNDRLNIVFDDAFTWTKASSERFDTIIIDFPDPDTPALGRLYSVEMYEHVADVLAPGGAMVVQCGSPFFAPKAYWTCASTLEAAGWSTLPYHVDVPSFGDWGFHLAAREQVGNIAIADGLGLRFLDDAVFERARVFPLDVRRSEYPTEASTVLDPVIVEAAQRAWIGYG